MGGGEIEGERECGKGGLWAVEIAQLGRPNRWHPYLYKEGEKSANCGFLVTGIRLPI